MTHFTNYRTYSDLISDNSYTTLYGKTYDVLMFVPNDSKPFQDCIAQHLKDHHNPNVSYNYYERFLIDNKRIDECGSYRRNADSTKLKNEDDYEYYPLDAFKPLKKNGKHYVFKSTPNVISNYKRTEVRANNRQENLPFIRYYLTGKKDGDIRCSISKELLESTTYYYGGPQTLDCFDLHHVIFDRSQNGSILKEDKESGPTDYLRNGILTERNEKNIAKIIELAGTVPLNSSYHADIHKKFTKGDITKHRNEDLPFALQNRGNWNAFKLFMHMEYGFEMDDFPTYEKHIASLTF